jgi:hypothetical protein
LGGKPGTKSGKASIKIAMPFLSYSADDLVKEVESLKGNVVVTTTPMLLRKLVPI